MCGGMPVVLLVHARAAALSDKKISNNNTRKATEQTQKNV
jgi:hypothetical protein